MLMRDWWWWGDVLQRERWASEGAGGVWQWDRHTHSSRRSGSSGRHHTQILPPNLATLHFNFLQANTTPHQTSPFIPSKPGYAPSFPAAVCPLIFTQRPATFSSPCSPHFSEYTCVARTASRIAYQRSFFRHTHLVPFGSGGSEARLSTAASITVSASGCWFTILAAIKQQMSMLEV